YIPYQWHKSYSQEQSHRHSQPATNPSAPHLQASHLPTLRQPLSSPSPLSHFQHFPPPPATPTAIPYAKPPHLPFSTSRIYPSSRILNERTDERRSKRLPQPKPERKAKVRSERKDYTRNKAHCH
ncbi:hypothetical protein C7212DRAFT_326866, partial [Tuber magnatum]